MPCVIDKKENLPKSSLSERNRDVLTTHTRTARIVLFVDKINREVCEVKPGLWHLQQELIAKLQTEW